MAEAQISTVLIPAYVVQKNNTIFITDLAITGQVLKVPCRNVHIDDVLFWATPVKDAQIFTTLYYQPIVDPQGNSVVKPTYDSFLVQRVRDKQSRDTWWIYVNSPEDFVSSCSTCCGAGAIPMPGSLGGFTIPIAPCDTPCTKNAAGKYYTQWALPTRVGSQNFFPYGSFNNVPFTAASGSGYSTPAALLAFLNAVWSNTGSPNAGIIWSLSVDNITLTATFNNGTGLDTLCVAIITVGASV